MSLKTCEQVDQHEERKTIGVCVLGLDPPYD